MKLFDKYCLTGTRNRRWFTLNRTLNKKNEESRSVESPKSRKTESSQGENEAATSLEEESPNEREGPDLLLEKVLGEKHLMKRETRKRKRIKNLKEEESYQALLKAEDDESKAGGEEQLAELARFGVLEDRGRLEDMRRRATRRIPEPSYVMPFDLTKNSIYRLYIENEMMEEVQMSRIFKDSKSFVDMKLKYPLSEILSKFEIFKNYLSKKSGQGRNEELMKFVMDNFEETEDLVPWHPEDWRPNPEFLSDIKNPNLRQFGKELNEVWLKLTRKTSDEVAKEPNRTSAIYLPNGIVIPGGRFREVYYWDTYWIVKGLLICGMYKTARGIIENLLYLVQNFGHIPNGTRKYYIGRSQPPLLVMMVEQYVKRANDFNFVKEYIKYLDAEMSFWFNTRRAVVHSRDKNYVVFRYYAATPLPRPESYREDKISASFEKSLMAKKLRYISLRSAAESGWDFSTRWFIFKGRNTGTLIDCATIFIIPVDLNSFMHYNFRLMAEWHSRLGNKQHAEIYKERANYLQMVLDELFWNEERGIWLDYDALHEKQRDYFYLSNFAPLWTKSYTKHHDKILIKVAHYIDGLKFEQYEGGFPTSIYTTTEQWDFPNAWPPLQAMLFQGLEAIGTPIAKKMASDYAALWLSSNYIGYKKFNSMFEKYDSINVGDIGGSGEYKAQEGFGWTNGVIFEILEAYGHRDLEEPPRLVSFYEAMNFQGDSDDLKAKLGRKGKRGVVGKRRRKGKGKGEQK